MARITIGPIQIVLPDGSTAVVPAQSAQIIPPLAKPPAVPPVPASLFATSFDPPASVGLSVNGMQVIAGVPPLPWGSPPLAIQCLGPASEHAHGIVAMPDGSHALHLKMIAGTGSDQAALLVEPRRPVEELYYRLRLRLDPRLATLLKPGGADNWTMLGELKTGKFPPGPYGGDLRDMLQVSMDNAGALHYRMAVDCNANDPTVTQRLIFDSGFGSKIPVVPGASIVMEHYTCRIAGREMMRWTIDGAEVARFAGPAYGEHGDPINRIMLTNLYPGIQERWVDEVVIAATCP